LYSMFTVYTVCLLYSMFAVHYVFSTVCLHMCVVCYVCECSAANLHQCRAAEERTAAVLNESTPLDHQSSSTFTSTGSQLYIQLVTSASESGDDSIYVQFEGRSMIS